MTIFHSIPTLLLYTAAVVLILWGTKKRNCLSFPGAICAAAAVITALVDGANLREVLTYFLILLFFSLQFPQRRIGHDL